MPVNRTSAFFHYLNRVVLFAVCLNFLGVASSVMAAPIAELKDVGGFKITLQQKEKSKRTFLLSIREGKTTEQRFFPEVLVLENPSRLVIDIPNHASKVAQTKNLTNEHLAAIRVGQHPDKVRVVIDVKDNALVHYQLPSTISPDSYSIEFSIGESESIAGIEETPTIAVLAEEEEEEVAVAPVKDESEIEVASFEPPVKKVEPKKPTATKKPEAVSPPIITPEQAAPIASEKTVVQSISFQSLPADDTPAVVIKVQSLGNYSLSKKGDNIYEIVLEGASLAGEHLSLPFYPPDTFSGLEAVIAHQGGGNITLKVFVDQSYKINPFRTKGELWLKVIK